MDLSIYAHVVNLFVFSLADLFKSNTEPLLLLGALQKISTEDLITIMKILQVISDNAQASKRKNKKDFIENLFDNCAATTDSAVDSLDVRCLPLGELSQKVLKVSWKETFYQKFQSKIF